MQSCTKVSIAFAFRDAQNSCAAAKMRFAQIFQHLRRTVCWHRLPWRTAPQCIGGQPPGSRRSPRPWKKSTGVAVVSYLSSCRTAACFQPSTVPPRRISTACSLSPPPSAAASAPGSCWSAATGGRRRAVVAHMDIRGRVDGQAYFDPNGIMIGSSPRFDMCACDFRWAGGGSHWRRAVAGPTSSTARRRSIRAGRRRRRRHRRRARAHAGPHGAPREGPRVLRSRHAGQAASKSIVRNERGLRRRRKREGDLNTKGRVILK